MVENAKVSLHNHTVNFIRSGTISEQAADSDEQLYVVDGVSIPRKDLPSAIDAPSSQPKLNVENDTVRVAKKMFDSEISAAC